MAKIHRSCVRYGAEDAASQWIARYAQARFSAFPNVQWCISNDQDLDAHRCGRCVRAAIIDQIGHDMQQREAWGTLLTNHQIRFSGYAFVEAPWSDIVTIEDMDQVAGAIFAKYLPLTDDPVVNDEDRYGNYRSPKHDRYFFRRLMWSSLLSGGHASYGGLRPTNHSQVPTRPRAYKATKRLSTQDGSTMELTTFVGSQNSFAKPKWSSLACSPLPSWLAISHRDSM